MDGLVQKSLMAVAALAIALGAWISGARAAELPTAAQDHPPAVSRPAS